MTELTKEEKVKNIFCFLAILFGDDLNLSEKIMRMTPEYLIEKFERYVLWPMPASDWGLHPSLRSGIFDKYCKKYKLKITSYSDFINDFC